MGGHYIGVTGIVTTDDVETARMCAELVPEPYAFMAGVLVSQKTLRGLPTTSRRYPTIEQAANLVFHLSGFAYTLVHYNTRGTDALGDELERVYERLHEIDGVQLNIVRPPPRAVAGFRHKHPNLDVVLQLNGSSVQPTQGVGAINDYVRAYGDGATHALLDLSGGRGRAVDPQWAAEVLRHWNHRRVRFGVAGGLGPGCGPILREIREGVSGSSRAAEIAFSVDAESGVRVAVDDPTPGEKHQDRLDRDKALAYVRAAVEAMTEPSGSP